MADFPVVQSETNLSASGKKRSHEKCQPHDSEIMPGDTASRNVLSNDNSEFVPNKRCRSIKSIVKHDSKFTKTDIVHSTEPQEIEGCKFSKEDVSKARKELRKLRNRASAAASRQKVRAKIIDLEEQMKKLQAKYNAALERLQHYEPVTDKTIVALVSEKSKNQDQNHSLITSYSPQLTLNAFTSMHVPKSFVRRTGNDDFDATSLLDTDKNVELPDDNELKEFLICMFCGAQQLGH